MSLSSALATAAANLEAKAKAAVESELTSLKTPAGQQAALTELESLLKEIAPIISEFAPGVGAALQTALAEIPQVAKAAAAIGAVTGV